MLYVRFVVLVPPSSAQDSPEPATVHMMFASDDIRECTSRAVHLFREKRYSGLQLKEAQMGYDSHEFSPDERVQRLFQEVTDSDLAWEMAEGEVAEEAETLSGLRV